MGHFENKIDSKNVEDILALTPIQQGILYESLLHEHPSLYLEQLSIYLSGMINKDSFEKAWKFVADSNELLRTVFIWEGLQKPIQIILKSNEIPIVYHDLSSYREPKKRLNEIREADKKQWIDLQKAPFRITLCKLSSKSYELIVSNHHILYDGWSTGIILKEFMDAYNKLEKSEKLIKQKKGKYKDYVKYLVKQDTEVHRAYWQEYLRDNEEKTNLPFLEDASGEVREFKEYLFTFDEETQDKINHIISDFKISAATFFYGVWGLLLQRYNSSNHVLFGTTVSVRPKSIDMINNMVGLFINTIPLAIEVQGKERLKDYFINLQRNTIERGKYSHTSLMDIKASSQLDKRDRLFDSVVVIENYPIDSSLMDKDNFLKINKFEISESTDFPLMIEIFTKDRFQVNFLYNESLFDNETIKRISSHFISAIENITSTPSATLSQVNILTKEELHKVLSEFNNNQCKNPKDKLVHEMFEEQVYKSADTIAAIFEDREITFRELNEKSNSLARVLRENGIRNGVTVGLMVERSIEMIIGMLAIFKSGGTLIPIDPDLPLERRSYMIQECGTQIVLVSRNDTDLSNGRTLNIHDENLYQYDVTNLENYNKLNDLAYIIYTSGSTGKPKGVMIEHLAVVDFIEGHFKTMQLNEGEIICALSTISFDLLFSETILPLVKGLKVVIASKKDLESPNELMDLIKRNNVDIIQSTPSRMTMLLKENKDSKLFTSLKKIMLGGDVFTNNLLNELREKSNASIFNLYGPTEATVWSTIKEITTSDHITIGKPFLNKKVYIVNQDNNLQPIGVVGELCIAGDCLSVGYLKNDELNNMKFIDNPFHNGKMYKTGDLARWLPNGELEFIGRADYQVKVQGYRIELGEIQNVIYSYHKPLETVVMVKENAKQEKYICAYIVSNEVISIEELRKHILERLPAYMCPSIFVLLDKMPLTMNGKIDRKALPEPHHHLWVSNTYEAPRNEMESTIVSMWREILKVNKEIGIHDDFFELGGQSLNVISLVGKLHKEFNIRIPIRDIFTLSTVSKLAEHIVNAREKMYHSIKKAPDREYYPISSAQKRLFVINQFDKELTNYNMPFSVILEGQLDLQRLQSAFSSIISRHESLRTSFEIVDGEPVQLIHKEVPLEFSFMYGDEEQLDTLVDEFIKPFDLTLAPLIRMRVVQLEISKYVLLIDMHHIISDGQSSLLIIDEMVSFYNGLELNELTIQYKDYVHWQGEMITSGGLAKQENYWLECFKDDAPVLNLPTDFERSTTQEYKGKKVVYEINQDLYSKLKEISDLHNVTLYMILLSAYYTLLYKYTNQNDITVGSSVSGRTHPELEKVIGMFVNTLVLRNKPEGDHTFLDFMMEVKQNTLRALENQDYPLENLVEKLDIKRTSNRNPLFDTVFVLNEKENLEHRLDDLKITPYDISLKTSKFDLLMTAILKENTILFEIEYSSSLFLEESMNNMIERYVSILNQITSNDSVLLRDIQLQTKLNAVDTHIDGVTFEF
ncbi:amino acid adenylation domain-containing protein [Virgibacillus pantothenticus]|uniref:non-ribosomal peptide synthetase n=1 Tax=Virgibacillus pantothenticus TaxID=1473 RepID=UPI001C23F37F|nr:non-ribosomal peptide synthetase [Virgibacillus pantothenticus]MBU8567942.1 amino acid adenylation domain-containing protein [Virgibacillus pantothenticus]MBU8601801.1 amino acid adenylation domain-containing protein [Virgibacillus pantothenticus]MBU8635955.1 amino acid adenylation domain-containing protein [Virgibacillus pantothenticus]MBU8643639.1 amino acid adenylation domain-containing protein [Virgibacillus pantothenticus]MBU8647779.1 amino acid adenylation domain-containing protein [V